MPDQDITLIAAQEAERLCPDDEQRQRAMYATVLQSLRAWEEYRAIDEKSMHWDLLHAHMARTSAEHHPASEAYHARMEWAASVASRLLHEHGDEFVMAHPIRRQICTGFRLPGFSFGSLF